MGRLLRAHGRRLGELGVEDVDIRAAEDDRVAVLYRLVGKGRVSQVSVERAVGLACRLREGKLWRLRSYLDPGAALEAVGLADQAMSADNVEIVRRVYAEGLIDRAVDFIRPLLAADVEYVNPADAIEPGTRRGVDDVMQAFGAVEAFDTAMSELRELFPAGNSVVAEIAFRARSRGSDVELTQSEAHTWTFRAGKVIRFEWSRDLGSALEAVGLTGSATVQDNVEIVRNGYRALAEHGVEAVLAITDPGFEATTPPSLASEPQTYRGHEGVRRFFGSFDDAMEGVYLEGQEFTSAGDNVLVDTKLHARGRTTGIETEQRAFLVWTLRDGLVTRVQTFADRGEALEAAGLGP